MLRKKVASNNTHLVVEAKLAFFMNNKWPFDCICSKEDAVGNLLLLLSFFEETKQSRMLVQLRDVVVYSDLITAISVF